MTQTIEQLTARVRELEEEKKEHQALLDFDNARLDQIEDELEDVEYLGPFVEGIKVLKTQLAAEQLNNKLLRETLEHCMADGDFDTDDARTSFKEGVKAFATPTSTEALDKYVAEKVNAKQLLIDAMGKQVQEFSDLLNAKIATLTRQRDLAAEALKPFANLLADHHGGMNDDRPLFQINDAKFTVGDVRKACEAISTIKESEAK